MGAPVALLWQHNANPSLRGVSRALLIIDRRVTEAFSTLRAVYRKWTWPSVVCVSSVCLSSVTLVHATQAVVIFGNFSTVFDTVAIR